MSLVSKVSITVVFRFICCVFCCLGGSNIVVACVVWYELWEYHYHELSRCQIKSWFFAKIEGWS